MKVNRTKLKLDWVGYQAAKYAVENWHYSKSMPAGKLARIGVYEDDDFKGVVIFGLGANNHLGMPFGLKMSQVFELVRIALKAHKTEVSRIVKISLTMIKKAFPKARIILSYADENYGHLGGIYKAGNWIYTGPFASERGVMLNGKLKHRRTINQVYGTSDVKFLRSRLDPNAHAVKGKPKHKYVMPLDEEMRVIVKRMEKPYPKGNVEQEKSE